jgi:hypothetical protein
MTSEVIYNKIACKFCDKEFAQRGMFTHLMRIHGTDEQKAIYIPGICKNPENTKNKIDYRDRLSKYNLSPNICKQCSTVISYDKRTGKFCNASCAAKYNNLHRSSTAKKTGPAKKIKEPKLKFSTLHKCVCKHCGIEWRARYNTRVCETHKEMYSHNGRAQFWFTFSLSSYPDLFDGTLIKQHGMRSKENPNGVTRDHRVSVQDAILNGYDPFYIKHPVNCELMLFKDNASKHTKSSITYKQLVAMVDDYEKK